MGFFSGKGETGFLAWWAREEDPSQRRRAERKALEAERRKKNRERKAKERRR